TWGKSGMVLFDGAAGDSIRGMPATGGAIAAVSSYDRKMGELQHAWPSFLPDGKHFLFQAFRKGSSSNGNAVRLGTLGSLHSVFVDSLESRAEFLPPDRFVYVKDGALFARRFDPKSGRLIGNPIVIGENAGSTSNTQAFSTSSTGTIAYQSTGQGDMQVIGRYDRAGHRQGTLLEPMVYSGFALSPDGHRLAVSARSAQSQKNDLWIADLARGIRTKFTFDPGDEIWPVWSPDGETLLFASDRGGNYRIFLKPVSGLVDEKEMPGQKGSHVGPVQWTPDGQWITAMQIGDVGDWNAIVYAAKDFTSPIVVGATSNNEAQPEISPDGRFIAYTSTESGAPEVYVQTFPKATGRWQVSTAHGVAPLWAAGGTDLLYRRGSGDVISVPVTVSSSGSFEPGTPVTLFQGAPFNNQNGHWDISRDGKDIYLLEPAGSSSGQVTPIIVILDANAELTGKDKR
ncbi:MAG: hypothetical protein ABI960_11360, partial [Candidatus Eisenbacteria bacterium]